MTKRSLATVALALAVTVLLAHARVVFESQTWDDIAYHTEVAPPRMAAAHSIARGEAPAWWEASGLGEPLLAEPTHGTMAPPVWLGKTPGELDLVMVLYLWWTALGIAAWARRAGASDPAAVVAGLCVATSGLFVSAALRGALPALAWLPWVALAASALAATPRARAAAGLAAALGMVALAGEFSVLVDALVVTAAYASAAKQGRRWFLLAAVLGAAVGAAQWLPAAFLIPREAGLAAEPMALSRLVELVVPGCFGHGDADRSVAAVAGDSPWFPSMYVGVALLALARPRGRLIVALVVIAAFALAAGRVGDFPRWLGAPELHVAAFVALLGGPAAHGIDSLLAGDAAIRKRAAIGLGALGVLLVMLLVRGSGDAIHRALFDGAIAAVCLGGAVAAAGRQRLAPLALALVAAPSFAVMTSLAPTTDRDVVTTPPPWASITEGTLWPRRLRRPPTSTFLKKDEKPTLAGELDTLAGTSGWWWGIGSARSDDPARLRELDQMWLKSSSGGGVALDRYHVRFPVIPESTAAKGGMHAVVPTHGLYTIVDFPVTPSAIVATGWSYSTDATNTFSLLFPPEGVQPLPTGTVVLDGTGQSKKSSDKAKPCIVNDWSDGDITTTCESEVEGYAVISSAPYPGWRATVDGDAEDWQAADVLRRAVPMPRGRHVVAWSYRAPGWLAGLAVSLLALAMVLVLAVRGRAAIEAAEAD